MSESNLHDDLKEKHKQENKDLRNKIQNLKNQVSKNDKKARKAVNIEIIVLETELERKHEAELKLLDDQPRECDTNDDCNEKAVSIQDNNDEDESFDKGSKLTKAQKRRNKKEQLERERNIRIKQSESEKYLGPRHIEMEALRTKLKQRQLSVFNIPSDGECLFSSISHQLEQNHQSIDVTKLRTMVIEEMRNNANDYLPFICETDEEFQEYLEKMSHPHEWGGHTEIVALSKALKKRIEIMQYDSDNVCIGEYQEALTIVYYKHSFGLGEHYNSCIVLSQ